MEEKVDLMEEVVEQVQEVEQVEESEVSIDNVDSVPKINKFRIITKEDKIPAKLTISDVKLGKCITKDRSGNFVEPEVNSKGGKYYKAKLILEIEEEINGDRIRTFIPSIFYSVDDDDNVAKIPTIQDSCPDEKLNDNFTSATSKLRNKYCKFKGVEPKTVSSKQFLNGLKGMTFIPEVEEGEYPKGVFWIKLSVKEFC